MDKKRQPPGTPSGGQFAPDTTGKNNIPTPSDIVSSQIPAEVTVPGLTVAQRRAAELIQAAEKKERWADYEYLFQEESFVISETHECVELEEDGVCPDPGLVDEKEMEGHIAYGGTLHNYTDRKDTLITGELADRIRAKLNLPPDIEVVLAERRTQSASSEVTVDHYFDAVIKLSNGYEVYLKNLNYYSAGNNIANLCEWLDSTWPPDSDMVKAYDKRNPEDKAAPPYGDCQCICHAFPELRHAQPCCGEDVTNGRATMGVHRLYPD